jgi:hypothetical protein
MVKIKAVGAFNGVSTRQDGISVIRFKFPFNEIANYSSTLMLINEQCKCAIECEGKTDVIPQAKFKKLNVDGEGEAKLELETFCNNIASIDTTRFIQKTIVVKIVNIV